MRSNLFKSLILVVVMLGATAFVSGDELDSLADGELTFAAKRGVKLSSKNVISNSNFKLIVEDSGKAVSNLDEVVAGQQFTISVKPNKNAHLYVFNLDTSNKLYALFPRKDIRKKNPIKKKKKYNLPEGDETFEFDASKGVEIFYAIASSKKIPRLEKLSKSLPANGKVISSKTKELLDNPEQLYHVPGKSGKLFYKKLVLLHKASESEKVSDDIMERAKSEVK